MVCGHLFCQKIINQSDFETLYNSNDKNSKLIQNTIYISDELFQKRVNEISLPKVEFASEYIDKKGLWIDIGAGVGDLLVSCSMFGWDAIGIESDINQVNFAKSKKVKIHHKYLNFNQKIKELKEAKVVSMINVLEHLPNPINVIRVLSKSIGKDSYLLIEIPRFPSLSSISNRCFPELSSRNIYPPDHLHLFSDYSLIKLFEKTSFDINAIWYYGQDIYDLFGNTITNGNFQTIKLLKIFIKS